MKLSLRPGCRGPFFVQFGSVQDLIGSIWALNIKKSDFYKKSKIFGLNNMGESQFSNGHPEAAAPLGAPRGDVETAIQDDF